MKKIALIILAGIALSSCANVKAYQRGLLGDQIMDPGSQFAKQKLDEKFFSTREGSIGGETGIGGGCGCAK